MDAIKLLTDQHEDIKSLFALIEGADDDNEKESLFWEIADSLAAHSTIEEKIFYPAAYAQKTRELLAEAVEEHLSMKRLISDLLDMSLEDENFDAKLKVLKDQVEHHVEEEEREIFRAARKEIGSEELERLGESMGELFEVEMEGQPRDEVPGQTGRAAPLR
jgi:hemerythrin-like domain-containing protein